MYHVCMLNKRCYALKDDGKHPKYTSIVDSLQTSMTDVHLHLSLPFCQAWQAYLNSIHWMILAHISWFLLA